MHSQIRRFIGQWYPARRAQVPQATQAPPAAAAAPLGAAATAAPAEEDNTPAAQAYRLINSPAATERTVNQACAILLTGYGGLFKRTATSRYRYKAEDVEEMLQDTVHRFVEQVPTHCDCPEAYFHRVFRNVVFDRIRYDRAQGRIPGALLDAICCPGDDSPALGLAAHSATSDPLEILMRSEWSRHVFEMLKTTSKGRYEAAMLLARGHSYEEIATTLDISNSAVRDRIHHLRRVLRAVFKDDTK